MKRALGRLLKKCRLLFSIPHFWLTLIIVLLIISSLIASRHYALINETFLSSMLLNLFAGLITGLIITVLSGIKFMTKYRGQKKLKWFKKLDNLIVAHFKQYRIMIGKISGSNEEFFNAAYDSGATMNYVNEYVIRGSFDQTLGIKPIELFNKKYGFNILDIGEKLENLKDYIIMNAEQQQRRKEVIDEINNVSRLYSSLRDEVNQEINIIQLKLDFINRSIV